MENRIRVLRKQKSITMRELGKILGVAESTISQYETGKREPSNETLLRLAEFFNVSVDYIICRDVYSEQPKSTGGVWVPVLGDIAAGTPIEAIENILDWEEIPLDMANAGEFFALRIKGASMEPKISDGDVVIIKRQPDVESGDIAAVIVNGESATVKRIKKMPEGIMLIPSNPAFEPMFYFNKEIETLPVSILGKVVELRAKF